MVTGLFSIELEDKINKIKNDSIHGAIYLTLEILNSFLKELEKIRISQDDFLLIIERMSEVHPEMVSIKNSLTNIARIVEKEEFSNELIIESLKNEIAEVEIREKKTIEKLTKEMKKFKQIMTLSSSSTINNALKSLEDKDKTIHILESRPLLEGRNTAKFLANQGFNVNLISDAASGIVAKDIEAIIIGADTVFVDGGVINKVGSLPLALVAKHYDIPFIVGASSNKLSTEASENFQNYIKEKPQEEVWEEKIEGIMIYNIYFDFIPSQYISKIISDR